MRNLFKKYKNSLLISLILLAGLLIRVHYVDKVIVGDLLNYGEWGERLATSGPKNFYFSEGWYYSVPVYPPLSQWTFAGMYWLNQNRHYLAILHNIVKFPPSDFIVYFYQYGYILLLKLPGILADLGLATVIYDLILKITKNKKKAFLGLLFFIINPIAIFISGAWGQTDSVVALFGTLSFLCLINRKLLFSMPLLFLSIYFKPSWAVLAPFYLFILYEQKPRLKELFLSSLLTLILFVVTTLPFSDGNVFNYGWKLFRERYPLPIGITGKASISAFNFQTIFFRLDIDYSDLKLLGITSAKWGTIIYIILNFIAFKNFRRQKDKLVGMLSGIFIIGMGSFLFMATMLERYFFPAFAPLTILMFSRPQILINGIIVNVILALNILYSFYRRGSDEIARPFTNNNFLVMKILSVIQVAIFAATTKFLLKSGSGK